MKILLLSPWFPCPPENGTKLRVYHLLKALAHKHEVTLLSFVRPGEHVDRSGLEPLCNSIQTMPWREFDPRRARAMLGFLSPLPRSMVDTYSQEADRLIAASIQQLSPDIIVASELGTARYAAGSEGIPKIVDDLQLGVVYDAWMQAASPLLRWRRGLTWVKSSRYKGTTMRRFDACTVVSERERAFFRKIAPDYEAIHVIPNGVDVPSMQSIHVEPQMNTLIYSGALTYSANYDAVSYFLESIFPRVLAQVPEAHLVVTGSTHGVNMASLALNSHVTLTGYLPDIRPAVASAWASVVPLRVGGGTRLKILEAMALGTPVVATPKGAEGLDMIPEEHLLIGTDAEHFAAQVVRLLRDPTLRSSLAENARRLVETHYDWTDIGRRFTGLVESLVPSRPRTART